MLYHLLIGGLGIAALLGLWIAIQSLVRRQSSELPSDSDVLACRTCGPEGTCHCGWKTLAGRQALPDRGDTGAPIPGGEGVVPAEKRQAKEQIHG